MMGDTIFIAMTDGHDTCSEVSADTVRTALEKLKSERSLDCIFMSANIGDARVVDPSMGFDAVYRVYTHGGADGLQSSHSIVFTFWHWWSSCLYYGDGTSEFFGNADRLCQENGP
jgi:hypothetical protein